MREPSVVTDNLETCYICGARAHGVHHLLFGNSMRNLADADGIYIPICDSCHVTGNKRIHDNSAAEMLSKMLGQALWELSNLPKEKQEELTKNFIKRYGRSYL